MRESRKKMPAEVQDEKLEKLEKKKGKRLNQEMALITYLFMILFLVMAGYMIYFVVQESDNVLNNPYNKRQDLLAKRVTKGSVLSDTGEKLAYTETDEEGNETRVYPYNGLFAHVVGRTSQGKTGIESAEAYTMLTSGINPLFGMINEVQGKKNPGNNVITTLNVELSQIASDALGSQKGAVVVMDPETGKILTMVSKPTYNPNNLSEEAWEQLTADSDEDSALYNRATQGLYPPGSTFKLYTVLEYMRENKKYNKFNHICTGSVGTDEDRIRCYGGEVHGSVDLTSAFADSCNVAFCEIGSRLNVSKWKDLCEDLYYNRTIPLTRMEQKTSQFAVDENTPLGDVMQASIGQGDMLVTPLQNALLVSAAVNKGKLMKPYIIDRIEDFAGNVLETRNPEILSEPISQKEAKTLKKLMRATVTEGTATALNSSSYNAGGKTGSAEFESGSTDSHAWFVGYAEKGGKKLVVSIIVERAGTGSAYAVPIAKKIFDAYW